MRLANKKTKSEKVVENFFPIDKENLKNTTEKQVKEKVINKENVKNAVEIQVRELPKIKEEISKSAVEKVFYRIDKNSLETIKFIKKKNNKSGRKKNSKKTNSKSTIKQIKYSVPKILLQDKGYEMIITEKPQAALKIASSLGNPTVREFNRVPFYELNRDGKKIIVACAVGHLFTLKQNIPGSKIPVFEISWFPNFLARKKDFTKRYYDTILKLSKGAGAITIATDFDVEGEVIGLNVVRYICGQKDAQRMKFSTLTKEELNQAYENKSPSIEWGQAIAGETRHYLDWFYGINLSRALMNSIKTSGKFRIMSIGRVQGPTLKFIVDREKEVIKFKSEPFWKIFITISDGKNELELEHNKDIFNKNELEKFKNLKEKTAIAETNKKENILPPPTPFNLMDLQKEIYKFYKINPSKTLQIAQSLYLAGLISYPRTSSQKLPPSIGYNKILKEIAKIYKAEELIKRKTPVEGKKTDPAHPSIYPTGNIQILSGNEEKIYNLIAKRFLALFCENAIIDEKKVNVNLENLEFSKKGAVIKEKNWMKIYPAKVKEEKIPDINGKIRIIDSRIEEKETQPPKRYSPSSILTELEKRNLGTKATRASILETLYDRNYISGESITPTPLGMSLISTLEKYSPIIIDEELTRNFEKEMEKIGESKKMDLEKEKKIILEKAKEKITEISHDFEKFEEKIGQELTNANLKLREEQKIANKLVQCPKCKKGDLAINYSKKFKRSFIACDAYPECKNTYSLPPDRTIKKTDKICPECNFPMLMALKPGKKPWIFCFNKECPTNKKRLEEYKTKQEEKVN